ncbi:hypothetical protein [Aurantimonas sp. VKM B-3413]|uniref:hypothetical protein n=1 Tax=Aurantimonas sp. VKM B-3413 TaxID=2779401 RepID=UPI001E3725D9|nr:hypothetical protein [Aurantimonas sp. VKM B-3413]MCB8839231.1 hypothetical protein [Aurantimonas sp. VKM B-3413]
MRIFRQLFRDRSAAFAAVLILVQLLLVQAAASAFGCAATGASDLFGGPVICHGGAVTLPGDPSQTHDCCLDCQCGIACGAQVHLLASLPPQTDLGAAFALAESRRDWLPPLVERSGPRPPPVVVPAPRGPPSVSV